MVGSELLELLPPVSFTEQKMQRRMQSAEPSDRHMLGYGLQTITAHVPPARNLSFWKSLFGPCSTISVSLMFAPREAGLINISISAYSFKIKRLNWSALGFNPCGFPFYFKSHPEIYIFISAHRLTMAVVLMRFLDHIPTRNFLQQLYWHIHTTDVLHTHRLPMPCSPTCASSAGGRTHSNMELDLVLYLIQRVWLYSCDRQNSEWNTLMPVSLEFYWNWLE